MPSSAFEAHGNRDNQQRQSSHRLYGQLQWHSAYTIVKFVSKINERKKGNLVGS